MRQDSACDCRLPSTPLAFMPMGASAVVLSVRGSEEACRHLGNLGFVDGARVAVACETGGNLIVEVKGARIALDRKTAMKISVGVS
ncbi:MAG: FeoA family protein [Slackia sp.]|nr:FeoA family protein [Slackia sp.]